MNIQILPGAIYFFKVFFFHFNTKGHIQHVPGANNKKKVQITKKHDIISTSHHVRVLFCQFILYGGKLDDSVGSCQQAKHQS